MTTITAVLLFLGTCVAGFRIIAFLAAAPSMPDAEAEEFGQRVEAAWQKYKNAEK